MFCSNCGHQVADGLSFCPSCGTKLAGDTNVQSVAPQQSEPQASIPQSPTQDSAIPQTPVRETPVQEAFTQQSPIPQSAGVAAAKKPFDKKKIGIIAGAAVVAAAAIIGVVSLISSAGSHKRTLFNDGLLPFQSDDKYGYINEKGEIAIAPQYDRAYGFSEGLACVSVEKEGDELTGFINKKGEVVIDMQYDGATDFKDGIAEVFLGDHVGFIDKKGKYIINPQYKNKTVYFIGYDMFLIEDTSGDFWTLCNKKGKSINDTRFDEPDFINICPFYNEEWGSDKDKVDWKTIPLKTITGNYIYINSRGKTVLETQYDSADYFTDGIAAVGIGKKHGYINKKGECIINLQFDKAGAFVEGLASVGIEGKNSIKYGYINKKGEYVVSPQYESARNFHNGVAIVSTYSKRDDDEIYGVIDKKGKTIIEPQYDRLMFGEDKKHLVYELNGNYGYINYKGETDIPGIYEYASPFYSDGYAFVQISRNEFTVIDSKGEKICDNMFEFIYPPEHVAILH
ncbi:WG repeat-containing protein [uncultured Ruminococcus sp.]|uniref:WG repeat-containing protein n=1 Tax=uncultured Ruminococcus sp. TaxID=165186 RepID=UPI0025DA9405|nr:WG repeat-containing protein [uncultured Ruminococcus sp.]